MLPTSGGSTVAASFVGATALVPLPEADLGPKRMNATPPATATTTTTTTMAAMIPALSPSSGGGADGGKDGGGDGGGPAGGFRGGGGGRDGTGEGGGGGLGGGGGEGGGAGGGGGSGSGGGGDGADTSTVVLLAVDFEATVVPVCALASAEDALSRVLWTSVSVASPVSPSTASLTVTSTITEPD